MGEAEAAAFLLGPLPDVLGRDRERAAGKHVVVVGAGHSAANTLLSLAQLRRAEPGTRVTWLVRGASVERAYGGGDADGLPARGMLGSQLRRAVEAGDAEEGCFLAGQIAGMVSREETAAEIVQDVVLGAEEVLEKLGKLR